MRIGLKQRILVVLSTLALLIACIGYTACSDDYKYDKEDPDFLGSSIYEFLENDGNFTCFLQLINDLNYREVLSLTGSKTLLPARDDAFDRFFGSNNVYGAKKYEDLTAAQKREIMNYGMINMAYLSYMLSNVSGSEGGNLSEGLAIRRQTSLTCLDSVPFVRDEGLFDSNSYWEGYKSRGLYLLDNEAPPMIVHFMKANMETRGITTEDFSVLHNGLRFSPIDFYINGIRIVEKDVICRNGYVHVMEDLLVPAKNMAQIIRDNGETTLFNELMNKFCLPEYSENYTRTIRSLYDGSTPERPQISDSIFIKRYFTDNYAADPIGNTLENYGLLYYDPADYAYAGGSMQDMGAMFVPTDQALHNYINSEKGRYLKDAYGSWENVPTTLLSLFLKNHQKKSFINSLPHTWETMTDESSFEMNVSPADIRKSYLGNNGAVYISDVTYPPVDYQCVYASTMTSQDTKIMNWGIQDKTMKFYLYLRSMENMYNLVVPVDAAFDNYRDPISWAGDNPGNREIWSFRYIPETHTVSASVYRADSNGEKGAFLRDVTNPAIIRNRLNDIIDMHIVVGEKDKTSGSMWGYIDDGNIRYALTKSGATLKISGQGDNMTLTGGGDLEQEVSPAYIITNPNTGQKNAYHSDNGKTYLIDRILHDPIKSTYKVMSEHSPFTRFFNLLRGDDRVFTYFQSDSDITPVFDYKRTSSSSGIGFVVNSFNNFRYTVFIPTEDALDRAFADDPKLFTWDEIADEEDYELKKEKTLYLLEFLKYHFMDNSVYIDGKTSSDVRYETAARNSSGKFRKVTIDKSAENLVITGENSTSKASIIKSGGLYNLMSRDYIVNSANYLNATQIVSSSRAVIHLIDNVLRFE